MMKDNIELLASLKTNKELEEMQGRLFAAIKGGDDTISREEDSNSNIEFVRNLVEKYPHLCDGKDKEGRYPIQVAVDEGKEDMVRLLIDARPESLYYETPSGESMLNLAVNSNSCIDLLSKTPQSLQDNIDAPRGEVVPITTVAHEAPGNLQMDSTLEVSSEGNSTRTHGMIKTSSSAWSHELQMTVLLMVVVFFAGGAYAALLNFHELYPIFSVDEHHLKTTVNLSIVELLTFPSSTAEGFLFLSTVTVGFITSMGVISYALCIICLKLAGWRTSLATVSLLMIGAMFLSFFAMLSNLVPNFVTIGGGHTKVPGVYIVLFYSIYMILVPTILALIARWVIRGAFGATRNEEYVLPLKWS